MSVLECHSAAAEGNLEYLKAALDSGANPNEPDGQNGGLPLHWAVFKRRLDIIRYLLDHKVNDVNCTNNDGNTPLHFSAVAGYKDITQMLVEAGASVNAVNEAGHTPLHGAVFMRHDHVVAYLLSLKDEKCQECKKEVCKKHRVDRDLADEDGNTPLHVCSQQHWGGSTYDLLLAAGADDTLKNLRGNTPMHPNKVMLLRAKELALPLLSMSTLALGYYIKQSMRREEFV